MIKKIYLMLNIAFLPFKDLTFYNQNFINEKVKHIEKAKQNNDSKEQLLDTIYRNILPRCEVRSLDEINLLLEKYYPFLINNQHNSTNINKQIYDRYFSIVKGFTEALLSHRDGVMVYKYWKNEKDDNLLGPYKELDKVHIFNIISRFMPMDILVASYYSNNGLKDTMQLDGFYQQINLADAQLDDVLVDGVAENHIHASSAFNFTGLWYEAMNGKIEDKYFDKFRASYYSTNNKVKDYIFTAKVLRIILAKFLYDNLNKGTNIIEWTLKSVKDSDKIINQILNLEDEKFLEAVQSKSIIEELKKDFNLTDGYRKKDIIFSIFKKDSHIDTYGENILLHYAFMYKKNYEKSNCENYEKFCNVFFKYISIKNEFYKQVTQSSTIEGLDFFRPYFTRATKGFNKKDDYYYKYMLKTLFQDSYLKKVELRLSIEDTKQKNKEIIKRILTSYKEILEDDYGIRENEVNADVTFPRIGIVYHLIKLPDDIEKCWCAYDESDKRLKDKLYYKNIQEEYVKLIEIMMELRSEVPYLANFIVGIDAANLENNTPVQVFAPAYNKARNSDCDPMLVIDRYGSLVKNQSLFFTFHAGEDFRHLNSGLRRIDEAIDYCKFHSGDRIGHGMALGINIKDWVKNNPVIIIPRGEYLDNLLWIWGVYSKNTNISSKAYIYLEQKIYNIAKEIFQKTNGLTVAVLYESYTRRFNEIEITYKETKIDFKKDEKYSFCVHIDDKDAFYWDSEKLYHAYHCKCFLKKITEPIYVNTSDIEEEMTMEMQKYLIRKVAMIGIVVEVNPTSNFAIGELNSVYDNQFFNINSPNDEQLKNVIININSDNPMVFNTNVSNEIAYLYYGMLERGVGKESALKWIEKIRKSGMDTSFIKSNISNNKYINSLNKVIEGLNDLGL